jgi:transcriptional regulator with XRE-family HTH domain
LTTDQRDPRAEEARDLRHALDLTQVELAKILGIRQATISDIETGKHPPKTAYLLALRQLMANKER